MFAMPVATTSFSVPASVSADSVSGSLLDGVSFSQSAP
jgi:hypothetical protein